MATPLKFTPVSEIPGIVARARRGATIKRLLDIDRRREALRSVLRLLDENQEAVLVALRTDLGKSTFEGQFMEIGNVRGEACFMLRELEDLMKPRPAEMSGAMRLENVFTQAEPLGLVLIIGAWNYPFGLVLSPLCGALAAGNSVVVKPSEVSSATAALFGELIPKYFDPDVVSVVNGAVAETTALLKERFDHILYTGNSRVGRIVMKAAAEHLTPVTLELGGKSPTIVDDTSDLTVTARRIMWGRFCNAGQTCVAPDYILVKANIKSKLIEELGKARTAFLNGHEAQSCPDLGRIVNDFHFKRVKALMSGGKVVVGGETDEATRFIAPTVLDDVDVKSSLMTDEIFGPLLPVVPYETTGELLAFINAREKPLALYVFSTNKAFVKEVLAKTSSGGVTVNDTIMHCGAVELPFGGVGESGMGSYHGKHSFETFSHRKPVFWRNQGMERFNDIRYPPYTANKLKWLRILTGNDSQKKGPGVALIVAAVVCVAAAVACAVAFWKR